MFAETYKEVLLEYEKFWERKNTKRPILNFSYKKNRDFNPYRPPVSLEEQYFDSSYVYNSYKHNISNKGYIAEGIPRLFPNFGPGCLAGAIGGDFELGADTVWYDKKQLVTNWENPPEITLDEQSKIWQKVKEIQQIGSSDPDVHVTITDLGGILDILASLRGTENLLYDLYDYPDEVKLFTQKIEQEWFKAFDQQVNVMCAAKQPFNNWMNIPSSKPWYPIQCDFSYMIAPNHFEEFVLPHLIDQVEYMDRSIYHLDGEGEIPHVDMLLDIPKLTGIQWTAGDGNAPVSDEKWFGLYKKIQDKKKNLVLFVSCNTEQDMNRLESLVKTLDPTGLYINTGLSSQQKAEELFENVIRWSK